MDCHLELLPNVFTPLLPLENTTPSLFFEVWPLQLGKP